MNRHTCRQMKNAKQKREREERQRVREADKAVRQKTVIGIRLPHGIHPSWYEEYLQTPHWRAFKLRYRRSDRPQWCVICQNPRYELHHRSYANIGAEQLDDVVALCRAHHARAHRNEKQGIPLKDAHLSQRMQNGQSNPSVKRLPSGFGSSNLPAGIRLGLRL